MRVKDVMTPNVICIGADEPILKAARLMLQNRISGLPVIDKDGELVGIVRSCRQCGAVPRNLDRRCRFQCADVAPGHRRLSRIDHRDRIAHPDRRSMVLFFCRALSSYDPERGRIIQRL